MTPYATEARKRLFVEVLRRCAEARLADLGVTASGERKPKAGPALSAKLETSWLDRELKNALAEALLCRGAAQEDLFALARASRDRCFPARSVEVRTVIEVSNICQEACRYCNMSQVQPLERYILAEGPLLELVAGAYEKGRRVILLQSGEYRQNSFVTHMANCAGEIKRRCPDLVIVLCLGNLSKEQYIELRRAGAERYILKFETSNPELYKRAKPRDDLRTRLACLGNLIEAGFEAGSGCICGLPGQTTEDLVADLEMLGRYPLSMSSCTAFIPGERSEFRHEKAGDPATTLNFMALSRILYPDRLIPTTSSLEKVQKGGQYLGLMAGANTVTVHDGTPERLKPLFPIYSINRMTPDQGWFEGIVEQAGMTMSKEPLR